MSPKNKGPRKSNKGKTRDDLLKDLDAIQEKEVGILEKKSEIGLDEKEVKKMHDEVIF
jgi:hypothetical protein